MDDNEAAAGQPQGVDRYREIGLKAVAAALLCQGAAGADATELSASEPAAPASGDHES